MDGKSVCERWQEIQSRVNLSLSQMGRPQNSLKIVGVSKKQSVERIQAALDCGLNCLGENYLQEFLLKKEALSGFKGEWHFVGYLQKNKIRDLVGQVSLIHSVDRESVAEAIGQRAQARHLIQDILIEVNIDGERSKAGVELDKGKELLEKLQSVEGIRICGLMAMPALDKGEDETRKSFGRLRETRDSWLSQLSSGKGGHHLNELSMGTSQDFCQAIEEEPR